METSRDETQLTEITIRPDGRVYVFGMSRPVLEVLALLPQHDERLSHLCSRLGIGPPPSRAARNTENA